MVLVADDLTAWLVGLLADTGRKKLTSWVLGTEQPTSTEETPRAIFTRAALGTSFRQEAGVGRMWSPMLELITDRDLEDGAKTNVDIMPQMQVTINRRQHIRGSVGFQVPVANTTGRSKQVVFYLLWDWFDGGFLEGWR